MYIHKRGVFNTVCSRGHQQIEIFFSLSLKLQLSLPCDMVCQNHHFATVHDVRFLFSLDIIHQLIFIGVPAHHPTIKSCTHYKLVLLIHNANVHAQQNHTHEVAIAKTCEMLKRIFCYPLNGTVLKGTYTYHKYYVYFK